MKTKTTKTPDHIYQDGQGIWHYPTKDKERMGLDSDDAIAFIGSLREETTDVDDSLTLGQWADDPSNRNKYNRICDEYGADVDGDWYDQHQDKTLADLLGAA